MRKNIMDLFLGYEKPKMSSWAKEQLAKQNGETDYVAPNYNLPTREEIIKANKRAERKRNLLLVVFILVILIYESLTGNSLSQQLLNSNKIDSIQAASVVDAMQ